MNAFKWTVCQKIIHKPVVLLTNKYGWFLRKTARFTVILIASGMFFLGGAFEEGGVGNSYAAEISKEENSIRNILISYHAALTSGDIKQIEEFVVTDARFAMVEGKHVNWGWADYRDNHLSAELAGLNKVEFRLDFKSLHVSGDIAYASFIFALSPKGDPTKNYGSGRATAVLTRENKIWLIQHLHTS